jgi:uncharacterized protein (UPF0332 family)
MHLREAELLAAAGTAPSACVHSAYYAMYHCAAAALLTTGGIGRRGDIPRNHAGIMEEYGKRFDGEEGILGQTGKMLAEALVGRVIADYALGRDSTNEEAIEITGKARIFVDACSEKWGFVPR